MNLFMLACQGLIIQKETFVVFWNMNKKKSIRIISILFLIATLVYKYNGKFYTKESRVDSSYVSAFNKDLNVQTHHENLSRNDWMKEMEKKYKQINKKTNKWTHKPIKNKQPKKETNKQSNV